MYLREFNLQLVGGRIKDTEFYYHTVTSCQNYILASVLFIIRTHVQNHRNHSVGLFFEWKELLEVCDHHVLHHRGRSLLSFWEEMPGWLKSSVCGRTPTFYCQHAEVEISGHYVSISSSWTAFEPSSS